MAPVLPVLMMLVVLAYCDQRTVSRYRTVINELSLVASPILAATVFLCRYLANVGASRVSVSDCGFEDNVVFNRFYGRVQQMVLSSCGQYESAPSRYISHRNVLYLVYCLLVCDWLRNI